MITLPPPREGPTRALIDELDAWASCSEGAAYKQASYVLVPTSTRRLLDLGCGTGSDALALAEQLGASVDIVGVDYMLELVEEAQRRLRNVALRVSFAVADARALPFAADSFDVVRLDRLLCSVDEPSRALLEVNRVLSRGGRVFIHEDAAVAQRTDGETTLVELLSRVGFRSVVTTALPAWPRPGTSGVTLIATKPVTAKGLL